MSLIDTEKFTSEIAKAASHCFADLVAHASGYSPIYVFALYTVDDLAGIVPSASTTAGFEERRDALFNDKRELGWLKKNNIDVNACLLGDYRWSAYEWEHESYGHEHFDTANAMLCEAVQLATKTNEADSYCTLTAESLACFVAALMRLKQEPSFFRLESKPTLFCSKPSSADTTWLEYESAKLLNTGQQFDAFKRERVDWIYEEGDLDSDCIPVFRQTFDTLNR